MTSAAPEQPRQSMVRAIYREAERFRPTVDDGPRDVRALLGMHTSGARLVLAVYLSCMAYVCVSSLDGISTIWPLVVAVGVLAAASVGLISAPGDPLPIPAATLIAASAPLTSALTLAVTPAPFTASTQGWAHGATTILLCFMCVRGRTLFAWLGLIGNVVVYGGWSALHGLPPTDGALAVIIDFGPVAIGAVFALTIRPAARTIFELRAAGAQQTAALAAREAAAAERDQQLSELDMLARPMLDRIASGAELSASERVTCELLEAHLRDRLRAPGLVTPDVADAVRAARSRGIEVILIDDGRADPMDGPALRRIHTQVIDTLAATRSGDVRVRLLPPNRASAASIYVRDADSVFRREFDRAGDEVDIASVMVGD